MTSHMDVQSSWIDRNESLLMGWIATLASQAISRPMDSSFQLGVRDKGPHLPGTQNLPRTPFTLGFMLLLILLFNHGDQVSLSPLTAYIHPDLHGELLGVGNSTDISMHTEI